MSFYMRRLQSDTNSESLLTTGQTILSITPDTATNRAVAKVDIILLQSGTNTNEILADIKVGATKIGQSIYFGSLDRASVKQTHTFFVPVDTTSLQDVSVAAIASNNNETIMTAKITLIYDLYDNGSLYGTSTQTDLTTTRQTILSDTITADGIYQIDAFICMNNNQQNAALIADLDGVRVFDTTWIADSSALNYYCMTLHKTAEYSASDTINLDAWIVNEPTPDVNTLTAQMFIRRIGSELEK